MSGLAKEQFDLSYESVYPYYYLVPYVHEVTRKRLISFESKTHSLLTLAICRHGLDLCMMDFTSDKCITTLQLDNRTGKNLFGY